MRWRRLLVLIASTSACNAPAPAPDEAANVIEWALGVQRRIQRPPSLDPYRIVDRGAPPHAGAGSTASRGTTLFRLVKGEPFGRRTRMTDECVAATSFLPDPARRGDIFFVVKGELHRKDQGSHGLTKLAGNDPNIHVTRLLALTRGKKPTEILAAAKVPGGRAQELWAFTIDAGSISRHGRVAGLRALRSKEAFFGAFDAPRCRREGTRCVVPNCEHEACYLDVEPMRGGTPEPLQKFDGHDIRDVRWAPGEDDVLYLLSGCP